MKVLHLRQQGELYWFAWVSQLLLLTRIKTLKLRLFASVLRREKSSIPLTEETGSICRYEVVLITAALPTDER